MNFTTTNNSIMQDKIYLENYTNIIKNCNVKCIKDYSQAFLAPKEQQCLEKCYFKSLNMITALSDKYGDLMQEINEADK